MRWDYLLPWQGSTCVPVHRRRSRPVSPFTSNLDSVFDSLLGDFFGSLPLHGGSEGFIPKINVEDSDESLSVTAEVPGMSEDDIDLTLTDTHLVLKGEKRTDYDNEGEKNRVIGRSYGRFERLIPLPGGVEEDKIEATIKNGVLKITLPKAAEDDRVKKIAVKG